MEWAPVMVAVVLLAAAVAGGQDRGERAAGDDEPFVVVLGVAQDGGVPHAGCGGDCCREAWNDPSRRRHVACLGIVDPASGQRWLVDATPDLPRQLRRLDEIAPAPGGPVLDGILLTHGHIGHYTGLMHLGREVMGTAGVPVHAMPRMQQFLRDHGPWGQLVELGNIDLVPLAADRAVRLNDRLSVTPLPVPHRDEYTETVGFRIDGPRRRVLFIPDIDKWERWGRPIEALVPAVDVAYLDGTFYGPGELPGRDMSAIPHPLITESIERLGGLSAEDRGKVRFIHLNHTNPALVPGSDARRAVERAGHRVAEEGERVGL